LLEIFALVLTTLCEEARHCETKLVKLEEKSSLGSGFDSSTEFQPIFKRSDEIFFVAPFLVKNEISCTTDGSFCVRERYLERCGGPFFSLLRVR
jgi:hypothetical protein